MPQPAVKRQNKNPAIKNFFPIFPAFLYGIPIHWILLAGDMNLKQYAMIIMAALWGLWFSVPATANSVIFPKVEALPMQAFAPVRASDGQVFELKGQIVILHFWATWCAPCIEELPKLAVFQNQFSEIDVLVVAVPVGAKNKEAIDKFYADKKITGPETWLDQEGQAMRLFRLNSLPATIIVGRDGKMMYRIDKPVDWDKAEVETFIRDLAAPKLP